MEKQENNADIYESKGIKTIYNLDLGECSDDEAADDFAPITDELDESSIPVTKAAQRFHDIDTKTSEYHRIKDETIEARYKRILWEIEDLQSQVNSKPSKITQGEVNELYSTLQTVSQKYFESTLKHIPLDLSNCSKVVQDIQSFKSKASQSKIEKKDDGQKMVYELLYEPKSAPERVDVSQIEKRINNLEKVIGLDKVDPVSTIISSKDRQSLFATSGTLIGALEKVDHHLSILAEPKVLESALNRISECNHTLENLIKLKKSLKIELALQRNEQLEPSQMSSNQEKTAYLYNQMRKLESVSNIIPHLIVRLKTLKTLHSEAAQFSDMIKYLDERQEQMLTLGNDIKTGIKDLTATIERNQSQIANNLANLNSRIDLIIKSKK